MNQHYIVEQMGHRRFGALVSEVEIAGVKMLRCEVLGPEAPAVSMVTTIHPNTIFALTECDETAARRANRYGTPVTLALAAPEEDESEDHEEEDDNYPEERDCCVSGTCEDLEESEEHP